jgi:hypothetical protein
MGKAQRENVRGRALARFSGVRKRVGLALIVSREDVVRGFREKGGDDDGDFYHYLQVTSKHYVG